MRVPCLVSCGGVVCVNVLLHDMLFVLFCLYLLCVVRFSVVRCCCHCAMVCFAFVCLYDVADVL